MACWGRCHAPIKSRRAIPDRRRATQRKPVRPTADSVNASQPAAGRSLSPRPDVTAPIQTASVKAVAPVSGPGSGPRAAPWCHSWFHAEWPRSGAGQYELTLRTAEHVLTSRCYVRPEKLSKEAVAELVDDLQRRLPASIAYGLQQAGALAGLKLVAPQETTLAEELRNDGRARSRFRCCSAPPLRASCGSEVGVARDAWISSQAGVWLAMTGTPAWPRAAAPVISGNFLLGRAPCCVSEADPLRDGPSGRWLREGGAASAHELAQRGCACVSPDEREQRGRVEVGDLEPAQGAVVDHRRRQDRDAEPAHREVGD